MADGITVEGIASMMKALAAYAPEAAAAMKVVLREEGEKVRADAQGRFEKYGDKSAQGYRVYLRAAGSRVDVEQSLSRTTGLRPEWGALQMREALIPALSDKEDEILADVTAALTALSEKTF